MNIYWDANTYKDNFSFVHQYGQDVLKLITAAPGGLAVDIGCGNGQLTAALKKMGYETIGIDASAQMLSLARQSYPDIPFIQADAGEVTLPQRADVLFSNAVIHWIDKDLQDHLAANLASLLKPGGQLVCEFGGKGCAESVHSTLEDCFNKRGLTYPRTFYFPSISEYSAVLERNGFKVTFALLFDRPTPQKSEDGLIDWINMFVTKPFEDISPDQKKEILCETRERLKGHLFKDGRWIIDYVRIRIKAIRL